MVVGRIWACSSRDARRTARTGSWPRPGRRRPGTHKWRLRYVGARTELGTGARAALFHQTTAAGCRCDRHPAEIRPLRPRYNHKITDDDFFYIFIKTRKKTQLRRKLIQTDKWQTTMTRLDKTCKQIVFNSDWHRIPTILTHFRRTRNQP